jgi:predicted RNA binding protein YcfA (HicA-like mRNA interferase family)
VTSFPAVKGKDLISALRGAGLVVVRTKGSHHFIRHSDGRATVVPVHAGETLGPGLLANILRDLKLTHVNSCRSCFDGSAI